MIPSNSLFAAGYVISDRTTVKNAVEKFVRRLIYNL